MAQLLDNLLKVLIVEQILCIFSLPVLRSGVLERHQSIYGTADFKPAYKLYPLELAGKML